jgi:hypothetical protein
LLRRNFFPMQTLTPHDSRRNSSLSTPTRTLGLFTSLRWTFFDPSCRQFKKPRPHLAKIVHAHASPTRRRFGH